MAKASNTARAHATTTAPAPGDGQTDLSAALHALQSAMNAHDSALARGVNLARSDWLSLRILVRDGAMRPGVLQRELGLTSGSVTALLDRLERRGLIAREHDPADRRALVIVPQPAAHSMLEQGQSHLLGLLAKVEERLGPQRTLHDARVIAGLAKLIDQATMRHVACRSVKVQRMR